MDVRAENRGRPRQKVRFSAAPVMDCGGETCHSEVDPGSSGRKGQECPERYPSQLEGRTKKFMFSAVFLPLTLASA